MEITHGEAAGLARAYTAAWNTGAPEAVGVFFASDGSISINGGEPWRGRARVAEMAKGFLSEVPDLRLVCDGVRCAEFHIVYLWTFTGTHSITGNHLRVAGWEEWDIDEHFKIVTSRGWFDAQDYAQQIAGTRVTRQMVGAPPFCAVRPWRRARVEVTGQVNSGSDRNCDSESISAGIREVSHFRTQAHDHGNTRLTLRPFVRQRAGRRLPPGRVEMLRIIFERQPENGICCQTEAYRAFAFSPVAMTDRIGKKFLDDDSRT